MLARIEWSVVLFGPAGSGWGGIRTPVTVSRKLVFKTSAFNHSATHPISLSGIIRCHHRSEQQWHRSEKPCQADFPFSNAASPRAASHWAADVATALPERIRIRMSHVGDARLRSCCAWLIRVWRGRPSGDQMVGPALSRNEVGIGSRGFRKMVGGRLRFALLVEQETHVVVGDRDTVDSREMSERFVVSL